MRLGDWVGENLETAADESTIPQCDLQLVSPSLPLEERAGERRHPSKDERQCPWPRVTNPSPCPSPDETFSASGRVRGGVLEDLHGLLDRGLVDLDLLEAALAAGFGSYAQFYRVFVAQRGTTPASYLRARASRQK